MHPPKSAVPENNISSAANQPNSETSNKDTEVKASTPPSAASKIEVDDESKRFDISKIEEFLIDTVKLGKSVSKVYAEAIFKMHYETIEVLKASAALPASDKHSLQELMKSLEMPPIHKQLLMAAIAPPKVEISETNMTLDNKHFENFKEFQGKVSANATIQNAKAHYEDANKKGSSFLSAAKKDNKKHAFDVVKELEKNSKISHSFSAESYEIQEFSHNLSSGALRKAIHFTNNSSFGARASNPFFDFSHKSAAACAIEFSAAPALKYVETSCFDDEEYRQYQSAEKQLGTALSVDIEFASLLGKGAGQAGYSHTGTADNFSHNKKEKTIQKFTLHKILNTVVQVSAFQLDLAQNRLDPRVVRDIIAIGKSENNVRDIRCADFFNSYGTHVLLTSQIIGGNFKITATVNSTRQLDTNERIAAFKGLKTHAAALAGIAPEGKVKAGGHHTTQTGENTMNGESKDKEEYSTSYTIETMGPQVSDFSVFLDALLCSNKLQCIVSNGFEVSKPHTWQFKPVWECIYELWEHVRVKDDKINIIEVSRALRQSWLEMVLSNAQRMFTEVGKEVLPATDAAEPILHPFMLGLVERCLKRPVFDEDQSWVEEWVNGNANLKDFLTTSKVLDNMRSYFFETSRVEEAIRMRNDQKQTLQYRHFPEGYYILKSSSANKYLTVRDGKLLSSEVSTNYKGQLFFVEKEDAQGYRIFFRDAVGNKRYLKGSPAADTAITHDNWHDKINQTWYFDEVGEKEVRIFLKCWSQDVPQLFLDSSAVMVKQETSSVNHSWTLSNPSTSWFYLHAIHNGKPFTFVAWTTREAQRAAALAERMYDVVKIANPLVNALPGVIDGLKEKAVLAKLIPVCLSKATPENEPPYALWKYQDHHIFNKYWGDSYVLSLNEEDRVLLEEKGTTGMRQKWILTDSAILLCETELSGSNKRLHIVPDDRGNEGLSISLKALENAPDSSEVYLSWFP